MSTYFTSDLHFGHANAIRLAHRPFETVDEMNHALLANINVSVGPYDQLYILGDFSYKISREEAISIAAKINCKNIHLVRGNHDKGYDGTRAFKTVTEYQELKLGGHRIVLFHYPIRSWNGMHRQSIHLHGHIHSQGRGYNLENAEHGTTAMAYGDPPRIAKGRERLLDAAWTYPQRRARLQHEQHRTRNLALGRRRRRERLRARRA